MVNSEITYLFFTYLFYFYIYKSVKYFTQGTEMCTSGGIKT